MEGDENPSVDMNPQVDAAAASASAGEGEAEAVAASGDSALEDNLAEEPSPGEPDNDTPPIDEAQSDISASPDNATNNAGVSEQQRQIQSDEGEEEDDVVPPPPPMPPVHNPPPSDEQEHDGAASLTVEPVSAVEVDEDNPSFFTPVRHRSGVARTAISTNPLNIFSPTRPADTPIAQTQQDRSGGSMDEESTPTRSRSIPGRTVAPSPTPPAIPPRPTPSPRPQLSTDARRASLLAKRDYTFVSCVRHQFPLIDAQVNAGITNCKRALIFLKKICDGMESHAHSMLKLTHAADETRRADPPQLHDGMIDHSKALFHVFHSMDVWAQRDLDFAHSLQSNVIKPLQSFVSSAEERRALMSKEEKNASNTLAAKNAEADKIRLSAMKSWKELVEVKKEVQAMENGAIQQGAQGKTAEKLMKKLAKAKENARKEFAKFEAIKDGVIARNVEYRTQLLPSVLRGMEELEGERLLTIRRLLIQFQSALNEASQPSPMLPVFENTIKLLNEHVDIHRCIDQWIAQHGMPPPETVILHELPTNVAAFDSGTWEQVAMDGSGSGSAAPVHRRNATGSQSTGAALPAVREDGAAVAPLPASNASSSSSSSSYDDDDDDDEGETLATLSQSTESRLEFAHWFIAMVDHPLPGTAEAATEADASTSSAASSSSSPPSSSSDDSDIMSLPLLHFSTDDVVRVTDRPAPPPGADSSWVQWWSGYIVGDTKKSIGRFPRTYIRHIDDKYTEPPAIATATTTNNDTNTDANGAADGSTSAPASAASTSFADLLRGKVSKKKKRFQADGFDLDLTYILPNVIAMGFPSEGLEGTYRNHLQDVQRFFHKRHPDNYKLYNLCSERAYDAGKFEGRVLRFPFDDHNPCALNRIMTVMQDIHSHLTADGGVVDPNRVAAIHCKAGKGRTGFIICCYLLYSGLFDPAHPELALRYYAVKRTKNQKGVTIPSQIRYVHYFARMLRQQREQQQQAEVPRLLPIPDKNPCILQSVRVIGIPRITVGKDVWFKMASANDSKPAIKYTSKGKVALERRVAEDYLLFSPGSSDGRGIVTLDNDVLCTFYSGGLFDTAKLFAFWINTRMIGRMEGYEHIIRPTPKPHASGQEQSEENAPRTLVLHKADLDKACKDVGHKLFTDSFRVELTFTPA